MKTTKLKVKNLNSNYSILVGRNILNQTSYQVKTLCPGAQKIALIIDKNVPAKFKIKLRRNLSKYKIYIFEYSVSEKFKSLANVNKLVEKCLAHNFNRNDVLISLGGGILGDYSAFAASIIKRGINFINIPTTLLAQEDSSIGGKTGVNSKLGKNLIGSFYQPKLVITDIEFLKSLPQRELVCGYAEILKHSLILKNNFFTWLKNNSNELLKNRNLNLLKKAIIESCKVKLYFVNKDIFEKNSRMILTIPFGISVEKMKGFVHHWEVKTFWLNGEYKYNVSMKAWPPPESFGNVDSKTLSIIKKLGRKVINFDQKIWNENVCSIAFNVIYQKFSNCSKLKQQLLNTKNCIIYEAAKNDPLWGIANNNKNIKIPSTWTGANILGWALMQTRSCIV